MSDALLMAAAVAGIALLTALLTVNTWGPWLLRQTRRR